MIRTVHSQDFMQIATIYNHYVTYTTVTFDEEEVSATDMKARFQDDTGTLPQLVYEEEGEVVAYAHAVRWKSRCAYKYTVECSIYMLPKVVGKGIGSTLYGALIEEVKALGYHTIIGGVALPNPASVRLHEKFGFEKVAHFQQVGYKFEQYIDVAYWQLHLGKQKEV